MSHADDVASTDGVAIARLDATIRGRVQGVGFRFFAIHAARRLELDGWVANEPDGSVRVVADGPRDALESLLEALHEGPPASVVERVLVQWPPVASGGFMTGDGFAIRSGGHRGD
jgi:acylphosphatase